MATIASNSNAPTLVSSPGRRITGGLGSGELLGARYRIIQLIGKGGFGAVYQANDERFQGRRRVAIKEMSDAHLGISERARAIANFRREADLLVQLKHSNLPDVSDFLEEGGKAYLIMEFVDGSTLEKIQENAGAPLDEMLVMGWALQLCDVLDYLHNQPQPIIFRDLKPPNIMLTRTNQIKLIDFGIARVFKSTSTKDTDTLGSQGYAPLEQYGRGQTDGRTDIYALGATLYDLLTNTVPPASPMRRIHPQGLVSPRQINPRIGSGVEQVILTAMEELPEQRYQSAVEMFQAISNLGFSIARNTGGISKITGPNAATIVSTQPGNYLTPATITPQPTQASTPPQVLPVVAPQQSLSATRQGSAPVVSSPQPAIAPALQQGSPGALLPAQQGAQIHQYAGSPTNSTPGPPAGSFQGFTQAPVVPPPGGGWPGTPGIQPSPQQSRGVSRRAVLVGGSVAVLAAATGIYFFSRGSTQSPGQAGDTVPVTFAYSTEKADWLRAAVGTFNQGNHTLNGSGKTIQIQLNDLGSVDGQSQILSGQLKPVAWSPASNLEINRLNYKWQQVHGGNSIISYAEQFQPRSLVKSPLVLAAWQQRAQALLAHFNVPTLDWPTLALALKATDWTEVGGKAGWGPVKFGQTLPVQSNSGLLTITLLAYDHFRKQRDLSTAQINDSGYWNALDVFEKAVNSFGHSSGTYLKNDIIDGSGPAQADVIATYENLVLTLQAQARSQQGQPLLIYYPSVNMLSDHPFAVLQGDWVTDEQKQAALQFRDFLLNTTQQRLALSYGFRPANTAVTLTDASASNNPFVSLSSLFPDRRPDPLQSQAQTPSGDIVDALITSWSKHYPSPATTDG